MKNVLNHLICLFLLIQPCLAELAIINDKDGYTNLRKSASGKSAVVAKILDHEIFNIQMYKRKGNWIPVEYKKTKGYMHLSRITPLSKMKQYKGKSLSIVVVNQPFDKSKHKITMKKFGSEDDGDAYSLVEKIDGKKVWGTDGGLPNREVKSITITLDGKKFNVDKSLYSNLYQMHNHVELITKKDDTYYIQQFASDGAGSYLIVWSVSKAKGVQVTVAEAEF